MYFLADLFYLFFVSLFFCHFSAVSIFAKHVLQNVFIFLFFVIVLLLMWLLYIVYPSCPHECELVILKVIGLISNPMTFKIFHSKPTFNLIGTKGKVFLCIFFYLITYHDHSLH